MKEELTLQDVWASILTPESFPLPEVLTGEDGKKRLGFSSEKEKEKEGGNQRVEEQEESREENRNSKRKPKSHLPRHCV